MEICIVEEAFWLHKILIWTEDATSCMHTRKDRSRIELRGYWQGSTEPLNIGGLPPVRAKWGGGAAP